MICHYRSGGSQCSRPGAALMGIAVEGHDPHARFTLCLDHVVAVVQTQGQREQRAGTQTIIEWA